MTPKPRPTIAPLAALALPLLLGILLFAVLGGCKSSSGPGGSSSSLVVAGSNSMHPFVEKWSEAFSAKHPGARVTVQAGGSTAGIQAALSGAAQIGDSSRNLKPEEAAQLKTTVVARDGIALIVHRTNPVANLTMDQVRAIYAGRVKSWKEVGGEDKPITVITREEGSGNRGSFEEMVMKGERIAASALVQDSTGGLREMVKADPASIGCITMGQANEEVKILSIDGVAPTRENMMAAKYPIIRPFLFVYKVEPTAGLAREFIDFVLSPEGQDLARKEGLIPAK